MKKLLKLFATASLSGLMAFALTAQGCSGDDAGKGDGGTVTPPIEKCTDPSDYKTCKCDVKSDCTPLDPSKASKFICTPQKVCIPICTKASDCGAGELCEDAQCRKPACGDDEECGTGQQCVAGACVSKIADSAVSTCSVQPAKAILHQGNGKNFAVVAKDAAGKVIPYHGDVTWGATGGVAEATGTGFTAIVQGTATAGAGTITAKVGTKDCTVANVTNFANAESGELRVVVASFADHSLITDATVVVGEDSDTTGENGSVSFEKPEGASTISVFKDGYSYVTYVGVQTNDVVVFLKPSQQPGKLTGKMTARTFDNLQDVRGTVHLGISGASIAGNVLDLSLSTLLGESVETKIDLGGSTNTTLPLPDGIVIGLTENMFKESFSMQSAPGLRTGWTLGGNVVLSDVLGVVSQATGGGDINVGAILSALLPVIGKLQASAYAGLEFQAGQTGTVPAGFRPETLLRLQTKVKVPTFSSYKVGSETKNYEGAVVLAGALYGSQGLVPLGLSAGIDNDKNGKVDPATMGGTEGEIALRLAPQNGGIEGSKYVALALAASFSGLIGGDDNGPVVLSGRVAFPNKLQFKDNATNSIDLGAGFLSVPDAVSIDEGERKLVLSGLEGVTNADFFRLDLGSDAQEWSVYFPKDTTEVVVPAAFGEFSDRFVGSDATLQVVSVKGKSGLDYQSVLTFDSDNTDDLTPVIDAFATRGISRTAVAP